MSTILIADDTPDAIAPLVQTLRRAGHLPLCAQDGDKAWQLMQQFHIDLLVTDRHMVLLSGEALVRRLRSHPRLARLPVIVTGTHAPGDPDGIGFAKPMQIAPVLVQIDALLRSSADRHMAIQDQVG